MDFLVHLIIAAAYLIVAAAAALGVPEALFGLSRMDGMILAGFAVLLGVLLQLALALLGQTRRLARLAGEHEALSGRFASVRQEMSSLQALFGGADPQTLRLLLNRDAEEVAAEQRLLAVLREQVAKSAANASAPSPNLEPEGEQDEDAAADDGAEEGESGAGAAPCFDSPEGRAVFEAVLEAVRENRVNVYLQPVVALPTRRTAFYESFSRITDDSGAIVTPERYLAIAKEAGVVTAIDNNLLFRCVQLVRKTRTHNREYGFFCNTSLHTLCDQDFFPQFLDFMRENRDLSEGLIFEFAANDILSRDPEMLMNLRQLAEIGFHFSLDNVRTLDIDFIELAERNFRYIKIEAERLKRLIDEDESGVAMELFQRSLERAGLELIVEKIESEDMLVEMLDYPIAYGQGYLFGQPRISRVAA